MNEVTFWRHVDMSGDCWEWSGRHDEDGYARYSRGYHAHRVAYELLIAPIPKGLTIDHLCRNRGCVNPDHLEVVSQRENLRRGEAPSARNARKTHCNNGHPFTPENTRDERGHRRCLTCARDRWVRV